MTTTLDITPRSQRTTRLDLTSADRTTILHLKPTAVPVPGIGRDIAVKFASERSEWEEAFHLVAANYRAVGYEAASSRPLRMTLYHALPDTKILVAKHAGHVVATFSIVLDNTLLGLPMESSYREEITALRNQGHRLMETTSLADTGLSLREFRQVFMTMIRVGMQYHTAQGGDSYVITVVPRHKNFYAKVLGFLPLGPLRSYAFAQDTPTEALWVSNALCQERTPRTYQEMFGDPVPRSALIAPRMPCDLLRYFAHQSSLGDIRKLEQVMTYTEHHGSARRW